ncbi:ThuA domain-containing protein [Paenibacillus daejeonensis]|uniref:ThuA domain-containing protein n=1 Tax=Paenibacillus daejeonensis TaxID=135193 RepID=UPI00036E8FB9|nr:ThuA domain-containing protein [Paenibacillus daejeonensis]
MKIGVLCGDRYHPAGTVIAGLQEAMDGQVELEVREVLPQDVALSQTWMKSKDVIVLAKINHRSAQDTTPWLTADSKLAIMDYVVEGGGLTILHAGTAGFKDDASFSQFIGGGFAYHPEPCQVTLSLTPANAPFPIDAMKDMVVHDEHYMMDIADESIDVFLTAASEHGMQAAGWAKHHGLGRICTLTPGHFAEVWREPGYQSLISLALRWCAEKTSR